MIIDYEASFGGLKPFEECDICGKNVDANGYCSRCAGIYDTTVKNYDIPEPLTRETLTPRRWKDIQLIKKRGKAAGKSQHEINVEIFNYAYHVVHPESSNPSPFLSICDIPAAPSHIMLIRGRNSICPICHGDTGDVGYNSQCSCSRLYSDERFCGHLPAPLTKRIFRFKDWENLQKIKQGNKSINKTRSEIDQLLTLYAQYAVAEMQAEVNNSSSPQIPAELADYIQVPELPAPPKIQPTAHSTTTQDQLSPTQHSKSWFGCFIASIADHFKPGECYICKRRYWTYAEAKRCCVEIKKACPPTGRITIQDITGDKTPIYHPGDPCPTCRGSGQLGGYMCPDCDGRGRLRLF